MGKAVGKAVKSVATSESNYAKVVVIVEGYVNREPKSSIES